MNPLDNGSNLDPRLESKENINLQENGKVDGKKVVENVAQANIIPKLIQYIKSRSSRADSVVVARGVCQGLTLLYAYYQFLNREGEFFQRIEQALNSEWKSSGQLESAVFKSLSKTETELEHLVNDILWLQGTTVNQFQQTRFLEILKIGSDKEIIKDLKVQFECDLASAYDKEADTYPEVVSILKEVIERDIDKSKFLKLTTSNHSLCIFYKNKECFLYDPNNRSKPIPRKVDNSSPEQLHHTLSGLVKDIAGGLSLKEGPLVLAIDVISPEELIELSASAKELIRTHIHEGSADLADINGHTPLMLAAEWGHADVVKAFIESGVDVDKVNKTGVTPLVVAALKGRIEVVDALIKAGAAVDKVNKNEGFTSLIIAALKGHVEIVKALIQAGASVKAVDMYGFTPLMRAVEYGHAEAVKVLIEVGAAVDKVDIYGFTPLMLAAKFGHAEVVKALIKAKAEVDKEGKNGFTPLMLAAERGHVEVVKALIKAGAEVDKKDKDGFTPFLIADLHGHVEVVEIFKQHQMKMSRDEEIF